MISNILLCNICQHSTTHSLLYVKWGFNIYKCDLCNTGQTQIPVNFDVTKIYDNSYFQGKQKDGYSDYPGSELVLRKEFRKSIRKLLEFTNPGGRLLEIGSAYGFFLLEAVKYFEATGLEISEVASAYARGRGLNIINSTINEEILSTTGKFDVLVLLDVIEHLQDPYNNLKLLISHLRPGGIIFITTGDLSSIFAQLSGKKWRLLTPPQHLFFFTKISLTKLLYSLNVEVLEVNYPWKNVPLGLVFYQITRRIGLNPSFLNLFNKLGLPINLYDAMQVIGKKKVP
jgi:SAM-dependent methyltransferase